MLSDTPNCRTRRRRVHSSPLPGSSLLKDFEEILLLAGNGYGGGAIKLLRSFYERVTTLGYLAANPNKINQFKDYTAVHRYKLYEELKTVHPDPNELAKQSEEVLANYEKIKTQFSEESCKCGKKTHPNIMDEETNSATSIGSQRRPENSLPRSLSPADIPSTYHALRNHVAMQRISRWHNQDVCDRSRTCERARRPQAGTSIVIVHLRDDQQVLSIRPESTCRDAGERMEYSLVR